MAYSLSYSDASIEAGIRRVAASQLDAALQDLSDPSLPQKETVLSTRKRCKKLRGVVRLIRPCFGEYDAENAHFRDIAKSLADARDSSAILETLDKLCLAFADELEDEIFLPLREGLLAHRSNMTEWHIEDLLRAAQRDLLQSRCRVDSWTLNASGTKAFESGLRATYGRARRLMGEAYSDRGVEIIHEWRKYTKYHLFHLRLLKACWPPVMAGYLTVADRLAKALGEHHDLAMLKQQAALHLSEDHVPMLASLNATATLRQVELEENAFRYGHKLFSETPKHAARRLADWWDVGPAKLN